MINLPILLIVTAIMVKLLHVIIYLQLFNIKITIMTY